MKALIVAAALAAATLAVPVGARADTADDSFVAYAQSMGISASRDALVQIGQDVCTLVAQGPAGDVTTNPITLANAVMLDVPSITDLRVAGNLAAVAVATYCPPG